MVSSYSDLNAKRREVSSHAICNLSPSFFDLKICSLARWLMELKKNDSNFEAFYFVLFFISIYNKSTLYKLRQLGTLQMFFIWSHNDSEIKSLYYSYRLVVSCLLLWLCTTRLGIESWEYGHFQLKLTCYQTLFV